MKVIQRILNLDSHTFIIFNVSVTGNHGMKELVLLFATIFSANLHLYLAVLSISFLLCETNIWRSIGKWCGDAVSEFDPVPLNNFC